MTHVYKVAVKDPTTVVKRNGVTLTGLINNSHYKFSSNTADVIEADKPIMVGQFMSGSSTCNPGTHGDPEMVYPSPIAQSINRIIFYRNTRESIYSNYLTLIIPTAGVSSLRIDGSNVFNHTYPHPNAPGYTVVVKGWKSAQAQSTVFSDSSFTAITYGLGGAESYAYNGGTYLNNLNLLGSIRNTNDSTTTIEHEYTCKGSPIKLSGLYAYKPTSLVWELSTLGSVITPNTNVIDNAPTANDSLFVDGIKYYKYTLPGTYIFNDTGTFEIPITSTHPSIENCNFSEKLKYKITVRPTPVPQFSIQNSGCTTDTVRFFGNAQSANSYTNAQHLWVLPVNDSIKSINAVKLFAPGNHIVKYRIVTNVGCVADSLITINVGSRPTATFSTNPLSLCENGSATFIDASGVTGTGPGYNFYWDFGNGTIVNAATNANQTTTYPNYGTYTVKHYVATSATCKSDTLTQIVTVFAKPRVNFTYPTLCVPPTGLAIFNNLSTVPDGQTLSYNWLFNDPTANLGNPNTSPNINATHFYNDGTYNVNLQAVSNEGCSKDTTIAVTIRKSPNFNYPLLPQICINNTAIQNFDNIIVTNGVVGTGVHSGPGMAANGQFNAVAAGIGTHTMRYNFSSAAGCNDSVIRVINVVAAPTIDFTALDAPCLDTTGIVQFLGTSNMVITNWTWTIPGSPTINTQIAIDTFVGNSTNIINLNVIAANGCVSDVTKTIILNVKPALRFTPLNAICQTNGAPISVAYGSVVNSAQGVGTYTGPGTSAAGIFTPATAGVGTHTIWYKFTTPNGCVDSISQTIQVKAKPVVSYTYPIGGCLPPTGFAQFNGNANLADAQTITTWAWNFNDANANAGNPNTSVLQNPSHNFTANGIYNVNLTATSSGGCVGDTTIALNFNIKPTLAYPAISSVCINATTATINVATASVTNGATGTGSYSGPGTSAAGIFTPATAGIGTHTIWYKFTTPNGCADSISQTIQVKAKPVVSYTYPIGGCLPANGFAQFNGNATLADAQTITNWAWNFNDANANAGNPNTSAVQNPSHNFTANGTYNVNLTATSSGGCTGDTTIALNFNIKPTLAYPAISSVCINATVATINVATANVTNGATGTGIYSGPGTSAAGIFTPATAGVGTHTIWYKFTTPNGCVDSISQTIQVKAKPVVSYTYPIGGCLPANGFAQFNGNANLADAQTITTWAWNFNDANANAGNPNTSVLQNPSHNFTANGIYNVNLTATSSGGCVGDTTIALNFNIKPTLAYPAISSVCINATTATINVATASVVNGATGTGSYSGPGTSAAGIFTPATAGIGTHTIWYKFTTPNGCADSISQTIQVKAKPVVSYTYPLGGCLPPTGFAQFNGNANLADAQTITTWAWNFNDANANAGNPNTSVLQNPSHNFTANGIYNVNLTATSSGGCVGDTTIALNFNIKPTLAYPAISSVCINATTATINVATASVTNGATGTGSYSGPGTSAAGIFTPATAGIGTHTIWYKFTTPNGCADSISQTIQVKAKPVVSYTYPLGGCLPPTGFAQFNGNANLADAQTITTWAWNFNDANANAGNPNTSVLQNPSHNFTANGIYNVNLTATSSGGCVGDTTIALNFNIKPTLAYPAIAPICQSVIGTINVATASVTNGATGVGVYAGPSTTVTGQFSPSVAGAGTFTIWYKFTTPNGCVDSISQTVNVQPKPIASFTKTDNCLGLNTTFASTSTIGAGVISNVYWSFGDGTFANNNGASFNKVYATAGTYVVKIVATSSAGCISDTAVQTVTIYEKPASNFTLPSSVCMPGNAVAITNTSTIAGAGVLSSAWNFGDGNTSITTNPSHTYASINNYTIKLIVTSTNGCVDSISKPFNAFFEKPIALFTTNKDTLCQGINSIFTDASTDPRSSIITSWAWSFGDATTANIKNPTKLYTTPNTYNVSLTVTNAAGCISSPFIKPVVVYLQPVVDAGPSFTVMQGTAVTFAGTANGSNGINFSWTPANLLTNANTLTPKYIANADATFTLTANGLGGCTATDNLTVKILKNVKIPNAFSPNGDGINDTWAIENLSDYTNCTLQIYNRYGQLMFKQTGYTRPWDGTYNGHPLPVATYYYILDLQNGLGVQKGSITIIK